MRARLDQVVKARLRDGAAVPALTCYEFTTAMAVVAAAESHGAPVILLVAPKSARGAQGSRFIAALRALADSAAVPVIVQLDHASDRELILSAVEAGVDAVLADGSMLEPSDNASFVKSIARDLAGREIVIEAELGALGGDEDNAHAAGKVDPTDGMTDPSLVPGFLAESSADLLAVAVGNVHGNYRGKPMLDWARVVAVREAAGDVPLVLHGASGLPDQDLRCAAAEGIGKVNINTELRTATLGVIELVLPRIRANGENMLDLVGEWSQSVHATADWAFDLLARPNPDRNSHRG